VQFSSQRQIQVILSLAAYRLNVKPGSCSNFKYLQPLITMMDSLHPSMYTATADQPLGGLK
jgi:hypothetical protein